MRRPDFITDEDITRWSENIDNDPRIPASIANSPIIREVCYAGLWISEELDKLNCPDDLIVRIQHAAGGLSFGRDIWETHQAVLKSYINNEIQLESEPIDMN
jgi:hypothetical protein